MKKVVLLLMSSLLITSCADPARRLMKYARLGNLTGLTNHLQINKIPLDLRDRTGATMLHWASLEGQSNIVAYLLQGGMEVDIRETSTGYTPLHMAAWKGRKNIIGLLLSYGADINAQDKLNGNTPLFWANAYGRVDTVDYLVRQGADILQTNNWGYNVLHVASREKYTLLLEYYLQRGTDIDVPHIGNGLTPLMISATMGHVPVFRLLLTNGADYNRTNYDGLTALDLARQSGKKFLNKYIDTMISNEVIVVQD